MASTTNFELGTEVLFGALVNLISQENRPFSGQPVIDNPTWRYYFGPNCNDDQKRRIIKRPKQIHDNRRAWAYEHRKTLGNPEVTWMVGRLLSTTTLIVAEFPTQSTYWDVFRNDDRRAIALTELAIHNECFGDWSTVQIPTVKDQNNISA